MECGAREGRGEGRYLVQPGDLGHIGDGVGAVLVIVGNHLGLLGREQVGSHLAATSRPFPPLACGLWFQCCTSPFLPVVCPYLLRVALGILNVDQHLAQAGVHRLHREVGGLQHGVALGLDA